MLLKLLISTALAALCIFTMVRPARGLDLDFCKIYVDGREAFVGMVPHSRNTAQHEALRAIGSADIRPSQNSPYCLAPGQDVNLRGDIEFAVTGQPSMRMQSLRIVYAAVQFDSFGNEQVGASWRIDRDDAVKIKAFYKPTAERTRNQQIGTTFRQWNVAFVIGGATALLLTVTFFLFYILFQGPRIIAATTGVEVPSGKARPNTERPN